MTDDEPKPQLTDEQRQEALRAVLLCIQSALQRETLIRQHVSGMASARAQSTPMIKPTK